MLHIIAYQMCNPTPVVVCITNNLDVEADDMTDQWRSFN